MVNDKRVDELREGKSVHLKINPEDKVELKIGFWIREEIPQLDNSTTYFVKSSILIKWMQMIQLLFFFGFLAYVNLSDWSWWTMSIAMVIFIAIHFLFHKYIEQNQPFEIVM
ncbi:hypothetical protein SAMN05192588_1470 [Nonlabens sp. Hel1_33_55]|nr:hypothetical protein SAMN05192588_1470 [Nonlabens sp. Hel1_33_55]